VTERLHVVGSTPQEPPSYGRVLTEAIRAAASRLEGWGEEPGRNNRGQQIDELRRIAGVGEVGGAGAWCAVAASAACVLGAAAAGLRLPFAPSPGAAALTRACGVAGSYVVAPQPWYRWGSYRGEVDADALSDALLIAWRRGGDNPRQRWQAHVELIVGYEGANDVLITWAGNVEPKGEARELLVSHGIAVYPGQAIYHLRVHERGAWRSRLYAVAGGLVSSRLAS